MSFLLDTNIVSELRRNKPHGALLRWYQNIEASLLFISAVTIGELQGGIEITRRQDPEKTRELESWLSALMENANVLPMDAKTFQCFAKIMSGKSKAHDFDGMIAATALQHNLILVSRNEKDFKQFGVEVLNPFKF